MGVRDEYAPRFGRQVLTVWSGAFCGDLDAEAVELPGHDGYMVTDYYNRFRVRVECEAPRTDGNWERVDAAILAAYEAADRVHRERARRDREAYQLAHGMARVVRDAFMAGAS